jgi:hypothetical protein
MKVQVQERNQTTESSVSIPNKKIRIGMVLYICNPALGRLRWEDCKFKTSLGYIVTPCLKKKKKLHEKIG